MDIRKVFGERLLNLREERGETQDQLAKAVGITRQSLSRYETNERTPNIELIYNIAKHYEVSADYLLGLSDVKSLDNRVQAACEVTGLSEKAILNLSKFRASYNHQANEKKYKLICPQIQIADSLISNFQFWLYCYDISCTLNLKRLSAESILTIKQTMERHIEEEKRLNPNYSKDEDFSIRDYYLDIENEEEWFEFKKWGLFKRLERMSNDMIDNYEDYISEEAENNGKHNPENQ